MRKNETNIANFEKHSQNLSEIGFFEVTPTSKGIEMFESQNIFYQFHTEGFELPNGCDLLAKGNIFHNQAFNLYLIFIIDINNFIIF